MKKRALFFSLASMFVSVAFAQTPATNSKPAPAPAAQVQATCNDGTPYTGATLKGACRGHGGVNKNANAPKAGAAPAAMGAGAAGAAASSTPAKAAPASAASTPATQAQAAGGGAGKVWANDSTKVYHCQGDKYYGKTKHGEYMTEADAAAKGFHPDHGKACTTKNK